MCARATESLTPGNSAPAAAGGHGDDTLLLPRPRTRTRNSVSSAVTGVTTVTRRPAGGTGAGHGPVTAATVTARPGDSDRRRDVPVTARPGDVTITSDAAAARRRSGRRDAAGPVTVATQADAATLAP